MNTSSVKAKHADFILIDMISIVISLAIAYLIRTDRSEDHIYLPLYEKIVLVILALYIILMLFNSYNDRHEKSQEKASLEKLQRRQEHKQGYYSYLPEHA